MAVGITVIALVVAGASTAAATSQPINCGSTAGNAKIGIVTSGSNYKTRETNSNGNSYLEADIQWSAPAPGAPATWYYGSFDKATTIYSPGVPSSNYPQKMAGEVWYNSTLNCNASVAASNWT